MKPWYASKTIWGSIIMMISLVLGIVTGTQISAGEQEQGGNLIVGFIEALATLVGFIMVIIGRIKATKGIGSTGTLKSIISIFALCAMLFAAVGCATSWQGKAVTGYEGLGLAMKATYQIAKPMCDQGQMSTEQCEYLKTYYNTARKIYLVAGDTLSMAIDVQDVIEKQKLLEEYQVLTEKFLVLSGQFIALAVDLKIIK